MCSMPKFSRARPMILRDLAAGLGRVEVVGATVRVEAAEQAMPGNRLGKTLEAQCSAFLRHQEGRVDLTRRIVHRDDQV